MYVRKHLAVLRASDAYAYIRMNETNTSGRGIDSGSNDWEITKTKPRRPLRTPGVFHLRIAMFVLVYREYEQDDVESGKYLE